MTGGNCLAHMTASAWVVNPGRTKVLMVYHNIYKSWSWLGGHANNEQDLLQVAVRGGKGGKRACQGTAGIGGYLTAWKSWTVGLT